MKKANNLWALKRVVSTVLAVLLIISAVPMYAFFASAEPIVPDDNLINGDFETLEADGTTISSWWLYGCESGNNGDHQSYAANHTLTSVAGRNDGKAAQIVKNGAGYVALTSNNIAATKGETYYIDYYIKVEDCNNPLAGQFQGGFLTVAEFKADGTLVGRTKFTEGIVKTISDWKGFSHSFSPSAETAYFRLEMYVGDLKYSNTFKVLFDDITCSTLPTEKLINGDFETQNAAGGVYSWWLYGCESGNNGDHQTYAANHTLTSVAGRTGGKAAQIVKKGAGYVTLTSNNIDAIPGETYQLDYYIKVEACNVSNTATPTNTFQGGFACIAQFKADGTLISRIKYTDDPMKSVSDWKGYTQNYVPGDDVAYFRIELYAGDTKYSNTFTILFDDVSCKTLPTDKLLNGSFEETTAGGSIYSWWLRGCESGNKGEHQTYADNHKLTIVPGLKGNAAQIDKVGGGYVTLTSNLIAVESNKTYLFTYAVKVTECNEARIDKPAIESFQGGIVYIAEFDANKSVLRRNLYDGINTVSDWKEFSSSYKPSSDAKYFRVELYAGDYTYTNKFTVLFDEVSIVGYDTNDSPDDVANGNFELAYKDTVFSWTPTTVQGATYTSSNDGYGGSKCIYIQKRYDGEYHASVSYSYLNSSKFSVTPGDSLKITYMYRWDNYKGGTVYGLTYAKFYDKDDNLIIAQRNNEADIYPHTVEWYRSKSYHVVPEGAVTCQVGLRFNGNNYDLWIDDVQATVYDPEADETGFDKADKRGEALCWTYTNPKDVKIDNEIYRDGTASLFISQDVDKYKSTLTYDNLIKVTPGLRYEFNVYVKSYDCDISADGIKLNLKKYGHDKEFLGNGADTAGLNSVLSSDSTPSGWKKLVLGYYVAETVGYVRPEVIIPYGQANLWIDDLTVTVYDLSHEFTEEFDSVSNNGIPDGWTQTAVSGNPEFLTGNSLTSITAKKADDIGTIKATWHTQMENRAMKYSMSYLTTGDTKAKVTIKFYGFNNQEIVADRIERELGSTGAEYAIGEIDFVLLKAKYMTIEVSNTGKGEVLIDYIKVVSFEEQKDEDDITWTGYWIWHDEDYQDSINGTPRYFRYHFTLAEDPVASFLQITADDRLKVYVNGVQYEDDAMNQRFTEVSVLETIHESLHKGDNVIAVAVNNFTAYAGLIFDGFAEDANGNRTEIISTTHVLSTKVEYAGWNEEKYDDSKWGNSKFMDYNANGIWPDDLTFDKSPYIKDKFEIVDYTISDTMIAGETGTLTMTIVPVNDFTKDMTLIGNIWIRNSLSKILNIDMVQVSGPKMSEWKAGEEITVSYKFTIPDFIASGKYNLQLDTNQVVVTNDEIFNNKFIDTIRLTNDISKKTNVQMVQSNGTFAISIDGNLYPYQIHNKKKDSYADDSNTSANMHNAGICITQISTPIAYNNAGSILEGVWIGEGDYNWSILDERIYKELAIHPDTYLMPQLFLAVPAWWMEKHPDQCVMDDKGNTYDLSMFSEEAIVLAHQGNVDMLNYMMGQPYWNRIIGFNLVGYGTIEFMWEVTDPNRMYDYSKPATEYFRKWLTKKYGTDAALQKAWNNPTVTLATATNPALENYSSELYDSIYDPETNRASLDYRECQEYREIEIVGDFHDLVAKTVNDTRIQGSYFGYLYTRAFYHNSIRSINSRIDELLDNPNIDFMAAPATYTERRSGEAAAMCQMVDGFMKKGKAVMLEDDYRACGYVNLSKNFFNRPDVGTSYNMNDSMSNIAKLQAIALTQGTAHWYYDIEGMMFEREEFSRLFEIMQNEKYIEFYREKSYTGEVAYIMDADGYEYNSTDGSAIYDATIEMIFEQKYDLARAGIMVDYYSMGDLVDGNVPDYKVYVMINTIEINAEEKAAINKYLKNNGKVVLWQWLAGASDGKKINAQNMSDVIGMNVTFNTDELVLKSYFKDSDHWLLDGITAKSMGSGLGYREASPVAIINDNRANVTKLASLYDDESYSSLAVMESKNWTSIFSSVPGYPVKMIRNVLKKAGVHIYSENSDDVVYANSNYVGINTAYGGKKTLKLDGKYAVYDVINQKTYSYSTDVINFTMTDNDTSLFRLMPENTNIIFVNNNYEGTISTPYYNEVMKGESFKCDIAAEEGYLISEIIIDTVRQPVNAETYTVSFDNVDNSHYVRVVFSPAADAVDDAPVDVTEDGNDLLLYILIGVGSALVLAAGIFLIIFLKKKKGNDENQAA